MTHFFMVQQMGVGVSPAPAFLLPDGHNLSRRRIYIYYQTQRSESQAQKMNQYEEQAMSKLPYRLAQAVRKQAGLCGGTVHEIRLRANKPLVITVNGSRFVCGVRCTGEELAETVKTLCGHSLYSHSATIREGYICAGDGIRAGICGQAVLTDGTISVIRDITSVAIRIPHRAPGAADPIYELIRARDFHANLLLYSQPGIGKTTILRELAVRLSSGEHPLCVAVVDTRCELAAGIEEAEMIDILSGYPRSVGIESAVRTLSPQYILCDEIMTEEDANAMIGALGSGVHFCASIHADSKEALFRLPIVKRLCEYHAFDLYVGLVPSENARYRFEISA